MENVKFEVTRTADSITFVFSSTFANIDRVCQETVRFLQSRDPDIKPLLFPINLVIREGLTNAVRHGNASDPEKSVKCALEIRNLKTLLLVIEDQGDGFDWKKQQHVKTKDSEDHGRGFVIMHTYFDRWSYNKKGNILYLEKDIADR
jgi:serine/threonine-protein kinase RsbW